MDLTADTGGLSFSLLSLWAAVGAAAAAATTAETAADATTTADAIITVDAAAKSPCHLKPLVKRFPLYKGIFLFTAKCLNGRKS